MSEKMYGSYSSADLDDWERFPFVSQVLTTSAFGAWLMRRDENIRAHNVGYWIVDWGKGLSKCPACRETYKGTGNWHFCPTCGKRLQLDVTRRVNNK